MDALEFVREKNRMCKSFGVECKNCPYYYKGEDDDFCYCHFEGDYLAPCEEDYYEDKDCDDWDKYDEEDD